MRQIILVLLISTLSTSVTISPTSGSLDQFNLQTREMITNIEVIIDPQLESGQLQGLLQGLDGYRIGNSIDSEKTSYNSLDINYSFLNSDNRQSMIDYLLQIENTDSPNGHSFDADNYNSGNRDLVFRNITGRSYDADSTLNWIRDNLWTGVENIHYLYIFNFTDLDGGMDHWFNIKPENLDTDQFVSSFYSRTSGLVYGKAVSNWGGHAEFPIHFIDLSAETWWGDFIETAWGVSGWSADIISQKLQDLNEVAATTWINSYVSSFIIQTYDLGIIPGAPVGKSARVQTLVLYDWYDYNIPIQDAYQLIQDQNIADTFDTAFPWLDFNISTRWNNLSEFPLIKQEMDKYLESTSEGYTLELNTGFLSYIEQQILPSYFDYSGSDIVLPSLVFFLNNTTFTYGGIRIAGLGGNGYQIQGLTPGRYFDDNGIPIRGFTDVLVHEIGHSLGLPHPFYNVDAWTGDFAASIMGYYTSYDRFSRYDINALGYYYTNYYLMQAETLRDELSSSNDASEIVESWYEASITLSESWQFGDGIEHAINTLCGYDYLVGSSSTEIDELCSSINVPQLLDKGTVSISDSTSSMSGSSHVQTNEDDSSSLLFVNPGILSIGVIGVVIRKYRKSRW